MRGQLKSNIIVIFIAMLFIGGLCFGIYLLSHNDIFDSSGNYIKGMADEKDVIGFVKDSEIHSYYELINSDLEDVKELKLKYFGSIGSKEVRTDRTAVYEVTLTINPKDSAKLKDNGYPLDAYERVLVPLVVNTSSRYNNFSIGDRVWVYGRVSEFIKDDAYGVIPRIAAIKVELDEGELV